MVNRKDLILQHDTQHLRLFAISSIVLFLVSVFTGYILWLMTKKKFAKWCTNHNIKKKIILKIHCSSSYFAVICGILHGIIDFQECETLWSLEWIAVYIMIILCFTGELFPKLSNILPNISWKRKKIILRIIHFILQFVVLVILIDHWLFA
ncbi:MAG: hypothetical protein ACFFA6_16305 [Promethearchaeota archaeon]